MKCGPELFHNVKTGKMFKKKIHCIRLYMSNEINLKRNYQNVKTLKHNKKKACKGVQRLVKKPK